jgi:hypothetical protein
MAELEEMCTGSIAAVKQWLAIFSPPLMEERVFAQLPDSIMVLVEVN